LTEEQQLVDKLRRVEALFAKKGRRALTLASVARILALNRSMSPATKSQAASRMTGDP